jgi:hypothetical protein
MFIFSRTNAAAKMIEREKLLDAAGTHARHREQLVPMFLYEADGGGTA